MLHFKTRVIEVIERRSDVKSFRFEAPKDSTFKPGQFFFVGINVGGEKRMKHFSFSNSPTEKGYVEFTKRMTKSPFSYALERLKKGDGVTLRMPYGTFTFEGEYDRIAFLSGGIGITPIRSMCKYATDKRLSTDIVLIYGNKKEEDIIFREDFEDMQSQNKNLRVVHTLTASDLATGIWKGRTGYIDASMIKEEIPDYKSRIFYLCGPPMMVECLVGVLENNLGLERDKIKTERFTGY